MFCVLIRLQINFPFFFSVFFHWGLEDKNLVKSEMGVGYLRKRLIFFMWKGIDGRTG